MRPHCAEHLVRLAVPARHLGQVTITVTTREFKEYVCYYYPGGNTNTTKHNKQCNTNNTHN